MEAHCHHLDSAAVAASPYAKMKGRENELKVRENKRARKRENEFNMREKRDIKYAIETLREIVQQTQWGKGSILRDTSTGGTTFSNLYQINKWSI